MTIAALAIALATAIARELLAWLDHRDRVRGQTRTRADDPPAGRE